MSLNGVLNYQAHMKAERVPDCIMSNPPRHLGVGSQPLNSLTFHVNVVGDQP